MVGEKVLFTLRAASSFAFHVYMTLSVNHNAEFGLNILLLSSLAVKNVIVVLQVSSDYATYIAKEEIIKINFSLALYVA